MSIYGAIFDLDGTVLLSEDAYGKAFGKVLAGLGVKNIPNRPHKGGIGIQENWKYLLKKYKINSSQSVQYLSQQTQQEFLANLEAVELNEGFFELIEFLRVQSIAVCLATSNEWFVVENILDKFNLENIFDVIVTGDEVLAKKPEPDIFLLAASKIGVDPQDCLVFEDSQAGIDAAVNADMQVCAVTVQNPDSPHTGADFVITDFTSVTILLGKLFSYS